MKYFIRTTLERRLDSSYSQIEYELLIDKEHRPIPSLIQQYKYINQFDCVLLEDDLILCKDFKNRIEKVISEHPSKIINFFFTPMSYQLPMNAEKNFSFSQCRYYPKGITKNIAEELERLDVSEASRTAQYVTKACKNLGYTVLQYRPCLIQHLDTDTLCQNIIKTKRTPFFIDYLDELGITYQEAKTIENQKKLRELMNLYFSKIDTKPIAIKSKKNRIYNFKLGYILHLWDTNFERYKNVIEEYSKNKILVSKDISIISAMNEECYSKSLLVNQCKDNNIDLIIPNSIFKINSQNWVNTMKLKGIVESLQNITTDYVLILDGKDTCLVNNLDGEFINNFKLMKSDIVFNCQKTNYPNIESMSNKENCYINAGVCFGYTKVLLKFYKQCYELSLIEEYISEYNNKPSEQYIIRKVAHISNFNIAVDKKYDLFTTPECDIVLHNKEFKELSNK